MNKVYLLDYGSDATYELILDNDRYEDMCCCGTVHWNGKDYNYNDNGRFEMITFVEVKKFMAVKSEVIRANRHVVN